MEKELVTPEIAFKLKYMGFNEPCMAKATMNGRRTYCSGGETITNQFLDISAALPLWQQAVRFLFDRVQNGKYRIIIVKSTGNFWLQERIDEQFVGLSDESNVDCVEKLIGILMSQD